MPCACVSVSFFVCCVEWSADRGGEAQEQDYQGGQLARGEDENENEDESETGRERNSHTLEPCKDM